MMPSLNLDFLIHEPDAEYRRQSHDNLSSHALADFRKCPFLYWKKREGLIADEDRPAYLVGRAAHVRILEGHDRYQEEFAFVGPVNPSTGKPYGNTTKKFQEWSDAQGKPVLTETQIDLIENMATGLSMNDAAIDLILDGVAEGVVRIEYCGIPCQSRIDWFNPTRGIVDLKTCDDLTWFEADARRYGYAHQLAFYQAMVTQAVAETVPVHLIAIEKKEPYRCGVWVVTDEVLAIARRENEDAVRRLQECESSGAWPSGYEDVRVFDFV